jgi:hypothetical protein
MKQEKLNRRKFMRIHEDNSEFNEIPITVEQIQAIKDLLPKVLQYIEANVAKGLRRRKRIGLARCRAATVLHGDADDTLTEQTMALLWAVDFALRNLCGKRAPNEVGEAFFLLTELRLMNVVEAHPIH